MDGYGLEEVICIPRKIEVDRKRSGSRSLTAVDIEGKVAVAEREVALQRVPYGFPTDFRII